MAMDEINFAYTGISCAIFLFTFLTTGIGTMTTGKPNCSLILETPLIVVTLLVMVLALILTICNCFNPTNEKCSFCVGIISLIFIPLLVSYTIISIYTAIITKDGKGLDLPDRAYDEYQLHAYSKNLQKIIMNSRNWGKVHKCLIKAKPCKRLTRQKANDNFMEFATKELTPVESGCCKPSYFCNFTYVTPTNWSVTPNSSFEIPDCYAWSNDPAILCYNCQSCKASVLENFKNKWTDVFKLSL